MTIEFNKEYTYKKICEALGWEICSGGNSKKAQIKEIESSFEFYHPINKKTHKEKKSYIFTKQLKESIAPSKKNCGGAHYLGHYTVGNNDKYLVQKEINTKKGVYIIQLNLDVYIGSTINGFRKRYVQHFTNRDNMMPHTQSMLLNGAGYILMYKNNPKYNLINKKDVVDIPKNRKIKKDNCVYYVYQYIHPEYGLLYFGRADNLAKRIYDHENSERDNIPRKYKSILKESAVMYMELKNKAQGIAVEAYLIDKYKPMLNTSLKYCDESELEMTLPQWKQYYHTSNKKYIKNTNYIVGSIEIWIANHMGKYLEEDEKKELIEICDLKDKYGRRRKSIGIISNYLKDNYGYTITNKQHRIDGKRVKNWMINYCE